MSVRETLIELIGSTVCEGPTPDEGGCPHRKFGGCGQVLKLNYCALGKIADGLMTSGVTVRRWIPVEEALPERFETVIVCRAGPDGEPKIEQGYKDEGDWWKVYGTRTKKVSHWMPLPKPPEVEL